MADLVITPANVVKGSTAKTRDGIAGETITAGQLVYEAASGKWLKADSDSATVEARSPIGIALHAASLNQPLQIITKGAVTIGAVVAAGVPYFSSATAGGIAPFADLAAGQYATFVGWGTSAAIIDVNLVENGVVKV